MVVKEYILVTKMSKLKFLRENWKFFFVVIISIALLQIAFVQDDEIITSPGKPPRPSTKFKCAYVIILMALLWMTEALPLAVTGFIPVVLFPILSVQSTGSVTVNYMRETVMMFIGGLTIAQGIEYCNLHRRIALKVMTIVGSSPIGLMFGVMFTTMFLSMWISNTATSAMMVPICLAVLEELRKSDTSGENSFDENMFLYSVAYSSNIGGTGVLTGTLPNLILSEMLQKHNIGQDGKYLDLTFTTWMAYNIPGTLINTLIAWVYLAVFFLGPTSFFRRTKSTPEVQNLLNRKYNELGPLSFHEKAVSILFLFVVMLWLFRDPRFVRGWAEYISDVKIGDSTAAMIVVLLLFIIPNGHSSHTLLSWKFVQDRMPWGVIIFQGSGFALSDAAGVSGLSAWVGKQLNSLSSLDERVILILVMTLVALITEVISNPATANIVIPILLSLSRSLNLHPLYLTLPATVSCSYAFMLPVGSPSNALVYAASGGRMHIIDMVKTGVFLNFSCLLITFCLNLTYGNLLFGYSNYEYANTTQLD